MLVVHRTLVHDMLHDYAAGKRRLLLPPVLRWRALTGRMTRDAEAFLNRLGMTIAGEEAGEKVAG